MAQKQHKLPRCIKTRQMNTTMSRAGRSNITSVKFRHFFFFARGGRFNWEQKQQEKNVNR